MDTVNDKAIKLPTFDGKKKSFQLWWSRFMAFAVIQRFARALVSGGEKDLPDKEDEVLDETKDATKIAARNRNQVAMAAFTVAFTTEGLLNIIYSSRTTKWPSGLAHKVVELLHKKYKPTDMMTLVELQDEMAALKLKKNQDPSELFEQLSAIQNKYDGPNSKAKPSSEMLMAAVMRAAPVEYQSALVAEPRRLQDKLTLDDMQAVMNLVWRRGKYSH
jgi:hypothetical protein